MVEGKGVTGVETERDIGRVGDFAADQSPGCRVGIGDLGLKETKRALKRRPSNGHVKHAHPPHPSPESQI